MWSKMELIEKQARLVLMSQGATLQAACDAVGVNRRSGRHCRQATGVQVPSRSTLRRGSCKAGETDRCTAVLVVTAKS